LFPIPHRSVILTLQDLTEPQWVPSMAEAGVNSLMLHAVKLPYDINQLIAFRQSDAGRRLFDACHEHGIAIEYEMHTASWLVPRMHFREHPEWFRMDLRGKRVCDCNFCFSCDEAWELFDARAQTLAAALPSETGRYLLFPDDVGNGSCHCPECASLSPSDQGLLYANRLQRAIRKVHADARVSFLAYHATLAPPDSIEPDEGVFIEFAPIQRCYRHALDEPGCAVNRAQVAALDGILAAFGGGEFHVTEYWLDASKHSGWRRPAQKIPVSMDITRRDIAFYESRGATSIATYAVMCDDEYWAHFGPPPLAAYGAALRGEEIG